METLRWPTLVFAGLAIGGALGRSLPDLAPPGASHRCGSPIATGDPRPAASPTGTTAEQTVTPDAGPADPTQKAPARSDPVERLRAADRSGAEFRRGRQTLLIVESLPPDSIATALAEIVSPGAAQYPQSARFLAERLAFERPQAAVEWLTRTAPQDSRPAFSGIIFRVLSERDPATARAALSALTDPEMRRSAARAMGIEVKPDGAGAGPVERGGSAEQSEPPSATAIANAGSAHPAEAARQILSQFPPSEERLGALGTVAMFWATRDPSDALRWAQSLQIPGERKRAIMSVLLKFTPDALVSDFHKLDAADKREAQPAVARWASEDPEAAGKWLADQPQWNNRAEFARAIAREWAAKDPRAAAAFALEEMPAGKPLLCTMETIAGKWAETDPGAALDWTATLKPSALRHAACIQIMKAWAKGEPQAAADYLTAFPQGELKDEMVEPVVQQWAQTEPRKAVALAQQIGATPERQSATLAALHLWGKSDPDAAARYLYEIPAGEPKEHLIASVSRSLVERDAQRALQWAAGFPDPSDRREALYHTVSSWASQNPEAAAAYALAIADPETRDRVAPDVAGQWADTSPESAARWAAGLPEGDGRKNGLRRVMSAWMEADEGAAARWLDNLPDGPSRDAVVSGYVYRLIHEDPEAAFRWSESVQNDEERRQLIGASISYWLRVDPQKAGAALQASDLPEQHKQMLLKMSRERTGPFP